MEKNKKYNMTLEEREYAYYLSNKEKELKAQISSANWYIAGKKVKRAFYILEAILLPAVVIATVASAIFVAPIGALVLSILTVPEAAFPLLIFALASLASPFILGSKVKDCNSDIESKKCEKEKYKQSLAEIRNEHEQKNQKNKYKYQTHDEQNSNQKKQDVSHNKNKQKNLNQVENSLQHHPLRESKVANIQCEENMKTKQKGKIFDSNKASYNNNSKKKDNKPIDEQH